MNKLEISAIIGLVIVLALIPPADSYIPPTRAFEKFFVGSQHIEAKNYMGNLTWIGSGISIALSNGTHTPTITLTNTGGSGLTKIQGSNLGTSGQGLFASNFNASMLQFYKLVSLNSNCVISSNSTNVILNCTASPSGPAPKVSINGLNASAFTIQNVTINGHVGQVFTITNFTDADPAPKVVINGNNRSSFISVANTTSANTINGHSVSFPSSNSGTLLLGNGSGASLTGIVVSSVQTGGHVSSAPSNSGTILDTNGTGAYLTNNVHTITANSPVVVNGSTNTVSISCSTCITSAVTSATGTARNVTVSASSGAVTWNLGDAVVMISGSAQTITKLITENLLSASSFIVDATDNTKKLGFLLSGATTGTSVQIRTNQTANQFVNIPYATGTQTFSFKPVINFTVSSNKTGTTGYTMLGDGVTLTPTVTGRIEVTVSGYGSDSLVSDGGAVQIRQVTGGCPSNGVAVTGTALGSNVKMMNPTSTASSVATRFPFSMTVQTTGLSISQKYCFELTQQAITGGTFTVFNVMWSAKEL